MFEVVVDTKTNMLLLGEVLETWLISGVDPDLRTMIPLGVVLEISIWYVLGEVKNTNNSSISMR